MKTNWTVKDLIEQRRKLWAHCSGSESRHYLSRTVPIDLRRLKPEWKEADILARFVCSECGSRKHLRLKLETDRELRKGTHTHR